MTVAEPGPASKLSRQDTILASWSGAINKHSLGAVIQPFVNPSYNTVLLFSPYLTEKEVHENIVEGFVEIQIHQVYGIPLIYCQRR